MERSDYFRQREWTIGLPKLQNKVGSRDSLRSFRRTLRKLSSRWEGQDFLGYGIGFSDDRLVARYSRRKSSHATVA